MCILFSKTVRDIEWTDYSSAVRVPNNKEISRIHGTLAVELGVADLVDL